MTIYTLGSINIDHVYHVPHIPVGGETLASHSVERGLGGKGANQSIAAALAGAEVQHIGAVGADGDWALEDLRGFGVDTSNIVRSAEPTGHAIIYVDANAENMIVLYSGANVTLDLKDIKTALKGAGSDDWLILQNETNMGVEAAEFAKSKGLRVCYSAAPFDADAVKDILPFIDLLAVNEGEAASLKEALGEISVPSILITKGKDGAVYRADGKDHSVEAYPVTPVDTTGAGDTFLGYFVGSLDQGCDVHQALQRASAAAALQVTKKGAAAAIPQLQDVLDFMTR